MTHARSLVRTLLLVGIPMALAACDVTGPETVTEKGEGTLRGYLDYSYDKNSVLRQARGDAVKRRYNNDPGKMFITGNSAGGAAR